MTLFCSGPGRAELLVSYGDPVGGQDRFKDAFYRIKAFSLLTRTINRPLVKLTEGPYGVSLHVPLTDQQLDDLQNDINPNGFLSVNGDEPRAYWGYVSEQISLTSLASSVRLVRRNCING
jgi:hypothetical protein